MTDRVALLHGTTGRAAEAIKKEGFVAWDADRVQSTVTEVAERYGIDREVLWANADLTYLRSTRPGESLVHFTGNWLTAADYASRAPEIEWELVLTAWRVRHDGERPVGEAERWAKQELADETRVIVTVEAPFDKVAPHLPTGRGQEWAPDNLHLLLDTGRKIGLPSPVDASWIVDISPAPRLLRFSDLADLVGVEVGQLARRLESGELPPPSNQRLRQPSPDALWLEEDIEPWLAEQGVSL